MDNRLSVITLGVADVSRSQAFYEALGWRPHTVIDNSSDHIVFFQTGGSALSLWDRAKLAADGGVTDTGGWSGVTLAYAAGSRAEVDDALTQAQRAGASITWAAANTFWGGPTSQHKRSSQLARLACAQSDATHVRPRHRVRRPASRTDSSPWACGSVNVSRVEVSLHARLSALVIGLLVDIGTNAVPRPRNTNGFGVEPPMPAVR